MTRFVTFIATCVTTSFACSSGVTSELVIGLSGTVREATRAHVAVTVGGRGRVERELRAADGPLFPSELEVKSTHSTDVVDVTVELYADPLLPSGPAILTRSSSTRFVAGEKRLLRLRMDSRCITAVPGVAWGPACEPLGQTCSAGLCVSPIVGPSDLEPYTPDWPRNEVDMCGGANGVPALELGTGDTAFAAIIPSQTLQVERGPQGGHHVIVAMRATHVSPAIAVRVHGVFGDVSLVERLFLMTAMPVGNGNCDVAGLRYQLENDAIDYRSMLGKAMDLVVDVRDNGDRTATERATVTLSTSVAGE